MLKHEIVPPRRGRAGRVNPARSFRSADIDPSFFPPNFLLIFLFLQTPFQDFHEDLFVPTRASSL